MLSKTQNLQKRMYQRERGHREHTEVFAVTLVTALWLGASSTARLPRLQSEQLWGLQPSAQLRVPPQHGPHLQKGDTLGQEGQFRTAPNPKPLSASPPNTGMPAMLLVWEAWDRECELWCCCVTFQPCCNSLPASTPHWSLPHPLDAITHLWGTHCTHHANPCQHSEILLLLL